MDLTDAQMIDWAIHNDHADGLEAELAAEYAGEDTDVTTAAAVEALANLRAHLQQHHGDDEQFWGPLVAAVENSLTQEGGR